MLNLLVLEIQSLVPRFMSFVCLHLSLISVYEEKSTDGVSPR